MLLSCSAKGGLLVSNNNNKRKRCPIEAKEMQNKVNEGGRQGEMTVVTHHSIVVFVGVVHPRHFSFVFVGMIMIMTRSLLRCHDTDIGV